MVKYTIGSAALMAIVATADAKGQQRQLVEKKHLRDKNNTRKLGGYSSSKDTAYPSYSPTSEWPTYSPTAETDEPTASPVVKFKWAGDGHNQFEKQKLYDWTDDGWLTYDTKSSSSKDDAWGSSAKCIPGPSKVRGHIQMCCAPWYSVWLVFFLVNRLSHISCHFPSLTLLDSQAGVDLPVGHHLHLPKLANGLREPHQRVPRDPKAPRARKVPRAVVARVARVNQAKIIQ